MIRLICSICVIAAEYIYLFIYKLNAHGISYCYNDVYLCAMFFGVQTLLLVSGGVYYQHDEI